MLRICLLKFFKKLSYLENYVKKTGCANKNFSSCEFLA